MKRIYCRFNSNYLDYGLGGSGFIPGVGSFDIFLHSFVPKLVLGSTQPPIK